MKTIEELQAIILELTDRVEELELEIDELLYPSDDDKDRAYEEEQERRAVCE